MASTTRILKEFVIPLENKPGTLAEVSSALGKAGINIQGFLLEAQGDYGIYRFVTSDPAKTETWLRQASRAFRTNDVLHVDVPNKPGELGRITQKLSGSGVNVNAAYPHFGEANAPGLAIAVNDVPTARKILG